MKKKHLIVGGIVVAALTIALTAGPVFAHGNPNLSPSSNQTTAQAWYPGAFCGNYGPLGAGPGALNGTAIDEAAKALGVTTDELRTELQNGQTIGDIASQKGIDPSTIINAIMAAHDEFLQQQVTNGNLTAEAAQQMEEQMRENVQNMIEGQFGSTWGYGHGMMGGYGYGGMMGGYGYNNGTSPDTGNYGSGYGFGRDGMMGGYGYNSGTGNYGGQPGGYGRGGMMGSW